jgi:hypothetical protein
MRAQKVYLLLIPGIVSPGIKSSGSIVQRKRREEKEEKREGFSSVDFRRVSSSLRLDVKFPSPILEVSYRGELILKITFIGSSVIFKINHYYFRPQSHGRSRQRADSVVTSLVFTIPMKS